MKKLLLLLIFVLFISYLTHAQNYKTTQPYGIIDTADLRLKDCDFEKGANAMVLIDKGEAVTEMESVNVKYYSRIKIFNNAGKNEANIKLKYYSGNQLESIKDIEAQTVNLENGQIVISKVDPSQIYTEVIDKNHKAFVFAFPQVKPGSIIEYRYTKYTSSPTDFPAWSFQQDIPVKYSELSAIISSNTVYNVISKGYQPFSTDSSVVLNGLLAKTGRQCWWAKTNIHSYVKEPFVTAGAANRQSISFQLSTVKSGWDYIRLSDTWGKMAGKMIFDRDFGEQLNEGLSNQDVLLNKAKTLSTDDEKIAYLFGEVKTVMTWNKFNDWFTDSGVKTAWNKKTGNSTEINLILYNLLKRAGIKVYPMWASTRNNGVLSPQHASYNNIDVTLAYVPTADTNKYYVLDASNKYNLYNEVPAEFLNTYGVIIDPAKRDNITKLKLLQNETPAKEIVIIDAAISADGTASVTGGVTIADYSYAKAFYQLMHHRLGDEQYIDYLLHKDNDLKITKPEFENMEVDSLPLMQRFNFMQQLTNADGQYIYFNPNLFTPLRTNPLVSEQRYSDIDFGYCNAYSINGAYKLPAGYKIDALPKNTLLSMPDKSITFKRLIGEQNGALQVHYTINFTRSTYGVAEYKAIREFYKKMFDMLNEPVVLKKG